MRSLATARTVGRRQFVLPIIFMMAGRTNSSKETIELTGLPGRPTCGTQRSPAWKQPKASGLPGFMATVQKAISPSRASTSFTTS